MNCKNDLTYKFLLFLVNVIKDILTPGPIYKTHTVPYKN